MDNKTVWMVEDFIKDTYLENYIDNLNFYTISKQLSVDIEEVMEVCIGLEKEGKIKYQYDIRDRNLELLDRGDILRESIYKAKDIFGENSDFLKNIYISIKLTEEYKKALDDLKKEKR